MIAILALGLLAQEAPRQVAFAELPPAVRLGLRVEGLRRARAVIPTLVIVPENEEFARAIARWAPGEYFPVLIDDGSARAGEDIARFARAFRPARIVRWHGAGEETWLPDTTEWMDDDAVRRGFIQAALSRACGMRGEDTSAEGLLAHWRAGGFVPPGIVAISDRDDAWTGGLALAAARGQPLAWISARGVVDAALPPGNAEELASQVEAACESTGLAWKGLGDDIEAVTIAANVPAKIRAEGQGFTAMTDRIGRLARTAPTEGPPHAAPRWGWAGQVIGDGPSTAYSAMSAIFLAPDRAWLFDGYPDEGDWKTFDASEAGRVLTEGGFICTVLDGDRRGVADWRAATARPLDAGLIAVNTKGMRDFFELEPGRGVCGDIPFLDAPAMVYFVHSFSAVQPANRDTIAGRWMERGAYAYFGSVHEPFLGAFVPTPMMASRLLWGYPWGAATRVDNGPEWRLAVIGDPLITIGPAATRSESPLPLEDVIDLASEVRERVAQRAFAGAIRDLAILGRDEEAVKLAAAILKDDAGAFDVAVAEASIMPALRMGRAEIVLGAIERLPADRAAPYRDALWLVCGPLLPGTRDERMVNLLRTNIRTEQAATDAVVLGRAVARVGGVPAAVSFLEQVKSGRSDKREIAELDRAIQALRR